MEQIECESRVMINLNDYLSIIKDLHEQGHHFILSTNENIYLDDKDNSLNKKHWMLRIRKINSQKEELTLKIPVDKGDIEINETLSNHPEIDRYLDNRFNEFHEVARLITRRIEIKFPEYLFVIDENKYHGYIDYDIEIEAKDKEKAVSIMKQYCQQYNLEFKDHYYSKSKRAIAKAQGIKLI